MKARNIFFVLALTPAAAFAQVGTPGAEVGDRELFLSASGTSDTGFDANAIGMTAEYGYYWRDNVEVGVRQHLSIADAPGGDFWKASTGLYGDYYFGAPSNFQPYAGASAGLVYGDINDTLFLSPEAGVKYYVKPDTFIDARAEYQIFFEDTEEIDNVYDDGSWVYTVGVGYNF